MFKLNLALLLFLLPLTFSPGPGNMFFAAIGGRFGLRASLPATIGYHLTTFVMTDVIGLGFAELAGLSSTLFDILRIGGSVYVLWLAWLFLRAGPRRVSPRCARQPRWTAAILLIINPKAFLIVVLIFSQFLPVSGVSDAALFLWITTVFTVNNLVAFTIWTLLR